MPEGAKLFAPYVPRTPEMSAVAPQGVVFAPAADADQSGIAALIAEREGFTHHQAMEKVESWLSRSADSHMQLVARIGSKVVAHARTAYIDLQPAESVPQGWYLSGVVVDESLRRRGIGLELTRRRLESIARRASEAFFFVNSLNGASIDLHRRLGFEEIRRPFHFPGVGFTGGVGVLFRVACERFVIEKLEG